MSNEKISSLDLVSAISEQSGTTKKVTTAFIRQFAETIEAALLRDGIVKIKGLGTFKIIWNESRSSINVNTGERYEIAGHNKISFTPDDEVSAIVNRPYAHLEPLDLDGNVIEKSQEQPEEDTHMKRFSEQASEIVNMITDMQAFKPKKKAKPVVTEIPKEKSKIESNPIEVAPQEIPAAIIAETTQNQPIERAEKITTQPETPSTPIIDKTQTENKPAPVAEITKEIAPVSIPAEPKAVNISSAKPEKSAEKSVSESDLIERMAAQPEKRSYQWLYITMIIVLLLTGGAAACYFFYPDIFSQQQVQNRAVAKPAVVVKPAVKAAPAIKPDTIEASVNNSVPASKPDIKKKTSIKSEPAPATQTKDIFETPRVYKEFLATETASAGTWLTMLSLKYYGHKLFWVYIYESNRDKLHNPEVLPPGTKIRIPKLDPRLIDKHNGRCFRQASELQTKYTTSKQ